jgi:hypothetical protein
MRILKYIAALMLICFTASAQLPISVRTTNGTAVGLSVNALTWTGSTGAGYSLQDLLGNGILSMAPAGAASGSNVLGGDGITSTPAGGNTTIAVDATVFRTNGSFANVYHDSQFNGGLTVTHALVAIPSTGNIALQAFQNKLTGVGDIIEALSNDTTTVLFSVGSNGVVTANNTNTINAPASSQTVLGLNGNVNNYFQVNIHNANSGTSSSSDYIATADNGTETTHYHDDGINSSTFTGPVGTPDSGYDYSTDDEFLGTTGTANYVHGFAGGTDTNHDVFVYNSNMFTFHKTVTMESELSLSATGTALNLTQGNEVISGGSLSITGALTVMGGVVTGNGSGLTTLNATQLTSGTVPVARIPLATTSLVGGVSVDGTTVLVNGSGQISASGTSDASTNGYTVIYTNLALNTVYTNTYGSPMLVEGLTPVFVTALVAGRCTMNISLTNSGVATNITPSQVTVGLIGSSTGSMTNCTVSFMVTNNGTFAITDTSTGAGNSVAIAGNVSFAYVQQLAVATSGSFGTLNVSGLSTLSVSTNTGSNGIGGNLVVSGTITGNGGGLTNLLSNLLYANPGANMQFTSGSVRYVGMGPSVAIIQASPFVYDAPLGVQAPFILTNFVYGTTQNALGSGTNFMARIYTNAVWDSDFTLTVTGSTIIYNFAADTTHTVTFLNGGFTNRVSIGWSNMSAGTTSFLCPVLSCNVLK